MAQVFSKSMNVVARISLLGLPLLAVSALAGGAAFYRSDYTTGAREVVEQPIPFSHKHHVGQLGIDCRYCHTAYETSASSGFPPTKTCMNCHQQMWNAADILQPLRDSWKEGKPISWTKVNNVPHYTYFNHSIHVAKGVGCVSCHGQIDEMNLVMQSKTLLMEWCLDCHRNPERHLRPPEEVTNMRFKPSDVWNEVLQQPHTQASLGKKLKAEHNIREQSILTNCSICHR
jgi:Cytochrome c7 and related cytochrome c